MRNQLRLNSIPVSTLGKKYVDFGGMFSPAAATCAYLFDRGSGHEERRVGLAALDALARLVGRRARTRAR